jgi:streptomycin 6-kinase
VVRADGTEAVLKIGVPNPELTTEIADLTCFEGRGAVRLLAADLGRGALLLERLRPGTTLRDAPDDDEATRAAARVMRRLWRPVGEDHRFPTVARWGRGFDRLRAMFEGGTGPLPSALVERAEGLLVELHRSMGNPVLLHGDLHQENVLRARRQPWLAIDPKGVVGDPAYEAGPLLRNIAPRLLEAEAADRIIARRVAILVDELALDRARLLAWAFVHMLLSAWWSVEDHGAGWEWSIYCAEIVDRLWSSDRIRTRIDTDKDRFALPICENQCKSVYEKGVLSRKEIDLE